jgi:hypothetical protein
MNIEERIKARAATLPRRRYRLYDPRFRVLLGVADMVTWLYFFGVPFLPNALPHLSDFSPIVKFFMEGIKQGMR